MPQIHPDPILSPSVVKNVLGRFISSFPNFLLSKISSFPPLPWSIRFELKTYPLNLTSAPSVLFVAGSKSAARSDPNLILNLNLKLAPPPRPLKSQGAGLHRLAPFGNWSFENNARTSFIDSAFCASVICDSTRVSVSFAPSASRA